jgi:hypothetical protein
MDCKDTRPFDLQRQTRHDDFLDAEPQAGHFYSRFDGDGLPWKLLAL